MTDLANYAILGFVINKMTIFGIQLTPFYQLYLFLDVVALILLAVFYFGLSNQPDRPKKHNS